MLVTDGVKRVKIATATVESVGKYKTQTIGWKNLIRCPQCLSSWIYRKIPRRISFRIPGGQAQFVRVPKPGGTLFDLDDSSTWSSSLPKDLKREGAYWTRRYWIGSSRRLCCYAAIDEGGKKTGEFVVLSIEEANEKVKE